MSRATEIKVYKDAVSVRGHNKDISVVKREPKDKYDAKNVIFIKALVSDTGEEPGVKHELSDNGKIKYSAIGLSDEAIRELYACLHHYLRNIG